MILGINRDVVLNDSTDATESDIHSEYEEKDEDAGKNVGEDNPYSYTAEDDNFSVIGDMFGDEQQVPSFFPPGTVLPSADPLPTSSGPSRRRDSFRKSDESYDGDGFTSTNDDKGFSFYQLRDLQYTLDLEDPRSTDNKAVSACKWFSTGYVLVAAIEQKEDDGLQLGAVWMLFNYRPENEDGDPTGKGCVIKPFEPVPGDPGHNVHSGLKFADNFDSFGPNYSLPIFNVTSANRIDSDFELVACHRVDSDKRIMRQYEGKGSAS